MACYIPLTKGRLAIVDAEDYDELSQQEWLYHGGYARRFEKEAMVHMHRVLLDCPAGYEVDHINRNSLDNRKGNLRIATRAQNLRNRSSFANTSSKFKGVAWHARAGVWQAQIKFNNRIIFIGAFETEEIAASAYNHYAREYFGEFALLNKVEDVDFKKLRILKRNCKSKYRGVTQNYLGKWVARITVEGHRHTLGSFATEEEAAEAYNVGFRELKHRKDVPNAL